MTKAKTLPRVLKLSEMTPEQRRLVEAWHRVQKAPVQALPKAA